ncbi:hypothetical protein [Sphingobium lignivorans]|uniref:Uncharacterized protein n=1 Tax=Sphingobium lignivorans TaxID=2735886 RepID=A0ABR6NDI2_9SPHN|nr:hypothetical protein [Sphingobium lignivorans]MBB5985339.1 hypothetical protein [Sphingobium lignivorans]
MSRAKSTYPSRAAVRKAINDARANGIDVGGYEIAPSGVIRVLDVRALSPRGAEDLFEQQLAQGLI